MRRRWTNGSRRAVPQAWPGPGSFPHTPAPPTGGPDQGSRRNSGLARDGRFAHAAHCNTGRIARGPVATTPKASLPARATLLNGYGWSSSTRRAGRLPRLLSFGALNSGRFPGRRRLRVFPAGPPVHSALRDVASGTRQDTAVAPGHRPLSATGEPRLSEKIAQFRLTLFSLSLFSDPVFLVFLVATVRFRRKLHGRSLWRAGRNRQSSMETRFVGLQPRDSQ